MTLGLTRRLPVDPRCQGLISASCTSLPRFRHRLSSDPASRRAPLLRRMVPVITVHRGLSPLECISLLDTPGRRPILQRLPEGHESILQSSPGPHPKTPPAPTLA